MNKVLLVGRIARDVEVKTTPSGRNFSYNAIACKREYKNKEGKYDSDFIPLTFGETTSIFFGKYVQKGDLVEVVGRWNVRKDGENGTLNECIVDTITLIEKAYTNKQSKEEDKQEPLFPEDEPKNLDTLLGKAPSVDDVSRAMKDMADDDLPF